MDFLGVGVGEFWVENYSEDIVLIFIVVWWNLNEGNLVVVLYVVSWVVEFGIDLNGS